jgi:hypothetical protein
MIAMHIFYAQLLCIEKSMKKPAAGDVPGRRLPCLD